MTRIIIIIFQNFEYYSLPYDYISLQQLELLTFLLRILIFQLQKKSKSSFILDMNFSKFWVLAYGSLEYFIKMFVHATHTCLKRIKLYLSTKMKEGGGGHMLLYHR